MTTLTLLTGQVSPITFVPAGSRVTLSGSGSVEWTPGNPSAAATQANWQTWGLGSTTGYQDTLRPLCIRVTATASCTVTIEEGRNDKYGEDAYWEEDIPVFAKDSAGNVTGLVGAGGAKYPIPLTQSRNVILIGDSITSQNWSSATFNTALGENEATAVEGYDSMSHGYAEVANALMGAPFTFVNAGLSGANTATMIENLALALENHPDADEVWIHGGINDLKPSAGGLPAATVANITTLADMAIAAGMRVVWSSILGAVSGASGWTTTQRNYVVQANASLKKLFQTAAYRGKVDIVDAAGTVVDTTTNTGWVSANYLIDDLHPSNNGAFVWAMKLKDVIAYRVPQIYSHGPDNPIDAYTYDNSSNQLLDDPLHLAASTASTGTGVTGDLPTGLQAAFTRTAGDATAVSSIVSSPDGIGKAIKLVVTGGAVASTFRLVDTADTPATTLVAGGQYQGVMYLKCTGVTGLKSTYLEMLGSVTGTPATPSVYSMSPPAAAEGIDYAGDFTICIKSPILTLPSDLTAASYLRFYLYINHIIGGGGTFEIYRRGLYRVA